MLSVSLENNTKMILMIVLNRLNGLWSCYCECLTDWNGKMFVELDKLVESLVLKVWVDHEWLFSVDVGVSEFYFATKNFSKKFDLFTQEKRQLLCDTLRFLIQKIFLVTHDRDLWKNLYIVRINVTLSKFPLDNQIMRLKIYFITRKRRVSLIKSSNWKWLSQIRFFWTFPLSMWYFKYNETLAAIVLRHRLQARKFFLWQLFLET